MQTLWFWIAVLAYFAAVMAVGVVLRRREKARAAQAGQGLEFWIARRELPGWWLGVSVTAGWLMLGWLSYGMAQVYQYGATGMWVLFLPWFVLCFIIVAMTPWVRRIAAVSVPQALGRRYGVSARALAAFFSFFVFIIWTQAELFIVGELVSPFLGLGELKWLCMGIVVAPIFVYILAGGFRAIVVTDVIQFSLMAVFMVVLATTAWSAASAKAPEGVWQALSALKPPGNATAWTFDLWSFGKLFPFILLLGFLPGWMVEQDLTLRLQAARSTRQAMIGAGAAFVLIIVFVLALPCLTAFCALVAFPPAGQAPAAAVGGDATGIISAFVSQMPLGGAVFMVVAIVACQMSTVDTFTNVSAMPVAYDLLQPLLFRGITERGKVALGRIVTAACLLIAWGLACVSTSLSDVYNLSSGVLSACIAVPALAAFWRHTTLPGVLAASLAGFAATLGMYWFEYKVENSVASLPEWLHASYQYNYVAAGVVVSVVVLVAVSLLTPRSAADRLAAVEARPVDDPDTFTREVT